MPFLDEKRAEELIAKVKYEINQATGSEDVKIIKAQVDDAIERMTALKAELDANSGKDTSLTDRVTSVEQAVESHESTLTEYADKIATINTLSTTLGTVEANVDTNTNAIANINEVIANMGSGSSGSDGDVFAMLENSEFNCPALHNSIYRGKSLGTAFTDEQKAEIANGTFKDIWVGDYWTYYGNIYRVAHIDYLYSANNQAGRTSTHHIAIVADKSLLNREYYMNNNSDSSATDDTNGGYYNSLFRKTYRNDMAIYPSYFFGSSAIEMDVSYFQVSSACSDGVPQASIQINESYFCELMSEEMVFGHARHKHPIDADETVTQLALFRLNPSFIASANNAGYWLRDTVSGTEFSSVSVNGRCVPTAVDDKLWYRPFHLIQGA